MNRYVLLSLLILLGTWPLSFATANPLPYIQHYTKTTYDGGTQNWDFGEDEEGRIFVANNEGLLVFDGLNWQRFQLPNATVVRSVANWPGHGILVGGQNELGLYRPNAEGRLIYHSLRDLVPAEALSFADVWDLIPIGEQVIIRTSQFLFLLENSQLTLLSKQGPHLFSTFYEGSA
ncbi:MAG: hypothetical protein AAF804_07590, partial [Bacteroidota bacterium]